MRNAGIPLQESDCVFDGLGRDAVRLGRILVGLEFRAEVAEHVTTADGEHCSKHCVVPNGSEAQLSYVFDEGVEIRRLFPAYRGMERLEDLGTRKPSSEVVQSIEDVSKRGLSLSIHDRHRDDVITDALRKLLREINLRFGSSPLAELE